MRPAKIAFLPREKTAAAQKSTQAARRFDLDYYALWFGLGLIAAFLIQDFGGFHWRWLGDLQIESIYRQLSGIGLVVFLAHQWHPAVLRSRGQMRQAGVLMRSHKLVGALTPLVFYVHSQRLGYAYLSVLSSALFVIFLSGILHRQIVRLHKPWLQTLWIGVHIGSAVILLILLGYHIYISYAYH
jgi:hypothetical protein